jgi:hypothetical protein
MGMRLFYVTVFAEIFRRGVLRFLLGFLEKLERRCGVFVVRLWWIGWQRWFAGGQVLEG